MNNGEDPEKRRSAELVRLAELVAELQTELNRADREQAAALDVGGAEDLQVLRLLWREGPQRVGAVAQRRATTMTTTSGRLDRLERRGLVTKERLVGDRRAMVAVLTDAGQVAAETSNAARLAVLDPIGEQVPLAAVEALVRAVGRTADALPDVPPDDPS